MKEYPLFVLFRRAREREGVHYLFGGETPMYFSFLATSHKILPHAAFRGCRFAAPIHRYIAVCQLHEHVNDTSSRNRQDGIGINEIEDDDMGWWRREYEV